MAEPSPAAAKQDVVTSRIWEAIVLAPDYLKSGRVAVFRRQSDSIFGRFNNLSAVPGLRGALLAGRVSELILKRTQNPVETD